MLHSWVDGDSAILLLLTTREPSLSTSCGEDRSCLLLDRPFPAGYGFPGITPCFVPRSYPQGFPDPEYPDAFHLPRRSCDDQQTLSWAPRFCGEKPVGVFFGDCTYCTYGPHKRRVRWVPADGGWCFSSTEIHHKQYIAFSFPNIHHTVLSTRVSLRLVAFIRP